ncbi:MAG: hypothetical protein ACREA0_25715 [bacterium]
MAVRVLSDSPIDVLRAVVRQHLGPPVWTPKDQLAFLMDPTARKQDPIQVVFADQNCTTRIDPALFALKRIVLKCMRERTHHICAQLGDGPPNSSHLTTDLYPIIAIQTDRAEHEDGTIQIHGHEMGIAILTAGQGDRPARSNAPARGQPVVLCDGDAQPRG